MAKGYLKEVEYRQTDICFYIRKLLKANKKHQSDLADLLGVTDARMTQKFNECSFTTHDLLTIFKYLNADQESVGKLFTFLKETK